MKRTKELTEARAEYVKREFDARPKGETLDTFVIRISILLFLSSRTIVRDLKKKGVNQKEVELLKQRALMIQTEANNRKKGETVEQFIVTKSKTLFVSVRTIERDLKRKDVYILKN